jgi:hypothetical protein
VPELGAQPLRLVHEAEREDELGAVLHRARLEALLEHGPFGRLVSRLAEEEVLLLAPLLRGGGGVGLGRRGDGAGLVAGDLEHVLVHPPGRELLLFNEARAVLIQHLRNKAPGAINSDHEHSCRVPIRAATVPRYLKLLQEVLVA